MLQSAASSLPIYLRRLAQSATSKAAFRFHVRIRGSLFPNEMKFKNGTYPFLGILPLARHIDLALAAAEAQRILLPQRVEIGTAQMMRLAVFERNGLCRTVAHTGSAHRAVVVKPRVAAFRDGQRGVGHDTAETAAHPAFGDEPLRKRKRPQPADVGHVPSFCTFLVTLVQMNF